MADLNVIQPQSLENARMSFGIKRDASQQAGLDGVAFATPKNEQAGLEATPLNNHAISEIKRQPLNAEMNTEMVGLDSVDGLVAQLNQQLEKLQNYLRFEKDEEADRMVLLIKNAETGEVIRQIPSQEFLAISKNISRYLEMRQQSPESVAMPTGLITNEKA